MLQQLMPLIVLTVLLCAAIAGATYLALRWSVQRASERRYQQRVRERLGVDPSDRDEALVRDAVTHRMEGKLMASFSERQRSIPSHWQGTGTIVGRPLGAKPPPRTSVEL